MWDTINQGVSDDPERERKEGYANMCLLFTATMEGHQAPVSGKRGGGGIMDVVSLAILDGLYRLLRVIDDCK